MANDAQTGWELDLAAQLGEQAGQHLLGAQLHVVGNAADDGDLAMLLAHAHHMLLQLQRFLVVLVAHARVHQLRNLQNLQQLAVVLQRQTVEPPLAVDVLGLASKGSVFCLGGGGR